MKKGYIAIDAGFEPIAAGVDEDSVKDWVFDFVLKDYGQTEIDEMLEELDYRNLDDLRADMVYRGFTDLWDYLGIEFKEAAIIGAE